LINGLNIFNNNIPDVKKKTPVFGVQNNTQTAVSNPVETMSTPVKQPAFGNAVPVTLNTTLRTAEEQKKFAEVSNNLDSKTRLKLNTLLKSGRLLSNDSNDKSTALDNLYKIITEKRVQGLDSKAILNDVVTALENPFAITQKFGDIPEPVAQEILSNQQKYATRETPYTNLLDAVKQTGSLPKYQPITKQMLDVISSSCVAASIQFNLAHKNPAEYARLAEGLSSEKVSVTKNIKLSDIAPGAVDAMWLLEQFKVPHKQLDWDNVTVEMRPDRNALVRARIQATSAYRDPGERSPIDVLMQSTFMNIGSQHTYNALTDIRTGAFNPDNRGLTDIEKNLAEVIAEGKNKISVTYQILDETGKITGYECTHDETLKHIKEALNLGENVIVGYTHTDSNNRVVNGHEITIIGIEKDRKGNEVFVCNDTDDMKDTPVKFDVQYLLPKIHHAGIPQKALKDDVQIIESWVDVLDQYKNSKLSPQTEAA